MQCHCATHHIAEDHARDTPPTEAAVALVNRVHIVDETRRHVGVGLPGLIWGERAARVRA